jgi:hypothetical protein
MQAYSGSSFAPFSENEEVIPILQGPMDRFDGENRLVQNSIENFNVMNRQSGMDHLSGGTSLTRQNVRENETFNPREIKILFSPDSSTANLQYYNFVFNKVREKINSLEQVQNIIVPVENNETVIKFKECFSNFKKDICQVYFKFAEAEQKYNDAKKKYTTFCESLQKTIHAIDICNVIEPVVIPTTQQQEQPVDDNEQTLKQLLNDRIDTYYNRLNLEALKNEYSACRDAMFVEKSIISEIVGVILPINTCSICIDKPVAYFNMPCGHTFCETCKPECEKTKKCHCCRTERTDIKKLFFN